MEKEFVPYELALRMKELGFDEPCLATFIYGAKGPLFQFPGSKNSEDWENCRNCSAPTWQATFKWFREKYGLHYCPSPKSHFPDNRINDIYHYEIFNSEGEEIAFDDGTYIIGESLEATALEKLIEIEEKI